MQCAECKAPVAQTAEICAECGAPLNVLTRVPPQPEPPTAADDTAPSPAKDARPWPVAVRWLLVACLIFFLILFAVGQVGVFDTPMGAGLHGAMVGLSWSSVIGVLLFLVLFECARKQFVERQAAWALAVVCSFGFLASLPFLWLALVRRRIVDWVVFAVYLAATVSVIAAFSSVPSTTSITGVPAATGTLLLVVGSVHVVLAYSRATHVPTWREAYPGQRPGYPRHHLHDAVTSEDKQQDGLRAIQPTNADVGKRDDHHQIGHK